MYKVNYAVPTANFKWHIEYYIAESLDEVNVVKAKCKELNYKFLGIEPERMFLVTYNHNGYPCSRKVKSFSKEDAEFSICLSLNEDVKCNVTEID